MHKLIYCPGRRAVCAPRRVAHVILFLSVQINSWNGQRILGKHYFQYFGTDFHLQELSATKMSVMQNCHIGYTNEGEGQLTDMVTAILAYDVIKCAFHTLHKLHIADLQLTTNFREGCKVACYR